MQFSYLILPSLFYLAAAAPTIDPQENTPESSKYVTKFPVCGALGFTEEPGDHYVAIYPPPPISKDKCIKACRSNNTCKAVSYAPVYHLCSFYSEYMKNDQLQRDNTSNFAHYDQVCKL